MAPLLPWLDDVLIERVVWQKARGEVPTGPGHEAALVPRLAAPPYDAAVPDGGLRLEPACAS